MDSKNKNIFIFWKMSAIIRVSAVSNFEEAIKAYECCKEALLKIYVANQEAEKIRRHRCSYSEVDAAIESYDSMFLTIRLSKVISEEQIVGRKCPR